jgi:hypothetical protein
MENVNNVSLVVTAENSKLYKSCTERRDGGEEDGVEPGVTSDCHFPVQLNRLITGFLSYSVADFLGRRLGSDRPWSAPGLARGGTVILTVYDSHDSKITV